jgi:hypothetical protein
MAATSLSRFPSPARFVAEGSRMKRRAYFSLLVCVCCQELLRVAHLASQERELADHLDMDWIGHPKRRDQQRTRLDAAE